MRRFDHPVEYEQFFNKDVTAKAVWSSLYSYRSALAHGGEVDFEKKSLNVLRDAQNATDAAVAKTAARLTPRRAAIASIFLSNTGSIPRLIVSLRRLAGDGPSSVYAASGARAMNSSAVACDALIAGRFVIGMPYPLVRYRFDIGPVSVRYRLDGIPFPSDAEHGVRQTVDFGARYDIAPVHFFDMQACAASR